MKVFDYLQRKYETEFPTTITRPEALVIGIPYPLEPKWMARFGAIEITPLMALAIRAALIKRLNRLGPDSTHIRLTARGIAICESFLAEQRGPQ